MNVTPGCEDSYVGCSPNTNQISSLSDGQIGYVDKNI